MNKKYIPYIVLVAAALLLFFVKRNPRGKSVNRSSTEISIPAATETPFDKNAPIVYSKHARCRMDCRHIDESEVKEILEEGQINEAKIEEDERGKTYPLEGITHDQQRVRIVVAPHKNELVIVTVIDLNKDWYCDCK